MNLYWLFGCLLGRWCEFCGVVDGVRVLGGGLQTHQNITLLGMIFQRNVLKSLIIPATLWPHLLFLRFCSQNLDFLPQYQVFLFEKLYLVTIFKKKNEENVAKKVKKDRKYEDLLF